MKRELLLLRHGKSDWSIPVSDFDRPLKKRGRKASQRMGEWLLENNLLPNYVLSSPAKRAIATAEIVCHVAGFDVVSIRRDRALYMASRDELLQVLARLPADSNRVLLVGHNPGMEELLQYLVNDVPVPEDGKLLPTAAMACLQLDGEWSHVGTGAVTLLEVVRPGDL